MECKVTTKEHVIYDNQTPTDQNIRLHFNMPPKCGTTYVRRINPVALVARVGDGEKIVDVVVRPRDGLEVHCDREQGSVRVETV